MAKYHVGVDVSKRKHKACIRNLSQDSYSGVFSFDVNREGFEKFLDTLEKLSQNKEDFLIGIEATGNYEVTLAYFLISHSYKVMEINPYRASQFRKAQGKKAKSDRIDAHSLATLLSLENHKSLSLPDPVLDNLRELTRFRADMVKDRTSLVNQLHEALSTLFPELATIFSRLDSPTCLSLLIAYPGPGYISQAGEAKIAESLRIAHRGKMREALAKALVKVAQDSVGVLQK